MIENLGDKIAAVATPIARMVGADCIDPETNELRPESPCAQRKRMLNEGRYADTIWDFLWPSKNPKLMKYIRTTTKIESVEAETPEEAQTKAGTLNDITVRVTQRPVPAVQPGRTPGAIPTPVPGFPMGKPQ